MTNILGDEADSALCEYCNKEGLVDAGVCCEACGGYFHRRRCWNNHHCGQLTDYNGRLVKLGDVLRYKDSPKRVLTVVEMEPTWVVGGHCRGERSNGYTQVIEPRLMELI